MSTGTGTCSGSLANTHNHMGADHLQPSLRMVQQLGLPLNIALKDHVATIVVPGRTRPTLICVQQLTNVVLLSHHRIKVNHVPKAKDDLAPTTAVARSPAQARTHSLSPRICPPHLAQGSLTCWDS